MSLLESLESWRIPLEDIKFATNNFSDKNVIGDTVFGFSYEGKLSYFGSQSTVVVQRLDRMIGGSGKKETWTEILMLSGYRHRNLVSLLGFCDEQDEKIIVYEHLTNGILENHLSSTNLTWMQRLRICVGAAHGLSYLHYSVVEQFRILHRDFKSSNVFLDDEFEAKVSFLEDTVRVILNKHSDFLLSSVPGTIGYIDPQYEKTKIMTVKFDVYSFGVVLFEVLCGRKAMIPYHQVDGRFLAPFAQRSYEEGKLDEIVYPGLRKQIDPNSLKVFSELAYDCLRAEPEQRPNMNEAVQRLTIALQLHKEFEKALKHQAPEDSEDSHYKVENLEHLRIPLEDIKSATSGFHKDCYLAEGGYGIVYRAELFHFDDSNSAEEQGSPAMSMKELCEKPKIHSAVAIKRLVRTTYGQGEKEFLTEIGLLSCYKHRNIISLLGYSDEDRDLILVYEYAFNGSLDKYLSKKRTTILSWRQRLQICLDAAHGLNFLHAGIAEKYRIIHRDVKASNILLGKDWEAKISDFGLSKIGPANQPATFVMTNVAGTFDYLDPQYLRTHRLTKESDVYSFGVVLIEVLCGSLVFEYSKDHQQFLPNLAQRCIEQGKLDEIIDPKLREEMEQSSSITDTGADWDSLNTFSAIAYQCLRENQAERPTMAEVIRQLDKALEFQIQNGRRN